MEKRCVNDPSDPAVAGEEGPGDATDDPENHTLCPVEFKMRIMVGMLNGIDYDDTVSGKTTRDDYVEGIQ